MARVCVLLACVIAVVAAGSFTINKLSEEIRSAYNLPSYRSQHPYAQLTSMRSESNYQQLRYTAGRRIANDRLVAQGNNNTQYNTPQDVRLVLRYPTSGQGAVITFVEIVVDQSNNLGNATIISGGIGYRNITIVVEAKKTKYFNYRAAFYGY